MLGDITHLGQISRMFEEGSGDRRCRDLSVVSHPWSTTPTTSVDHCQGIAMHNQTTPTTLKATSAINVVFSPYQMWLQTTSVILGLLDCIKEFVILVISN